MWMLRRSPYSSRIWISRSNSQRAWVSRGAPATSGQTRTGRGGKLLAGVFGMQRHHARRDAPLLLGALQPRGGQLLAPRP
jgi:hypothetical protein